MDQQNISLSSISKNITLCIAIIVALLFLISSSQFMYASGLNYSSVTNLSSSWINKPTSWKNVESTLLPPTFDELVTPILSSKSNTTNFVCGFYCPNDGTARCLFGVLIYPLQFPVHADEPKLIWSANRDHPVKIKATLNFTSGGDMILKDADDSLVWSTGTRGKNISRLQLTEIGNLVLYNKVHKIVWQSFDHPTDSILPGQFLVMGQKLTSSNSPSDWSQGLFSVDIQNGLFVAYIKSNPPQRYFQTSHIGGLDTQVFNGRRLKFEFYPSITQFIRLDPDGHLRLYEWLGPYSLKGYDYLTLHNDECGYPLVCGRYGLCSKNGQCSCPKNETISFTPTYYWQPADRCTMITPISCDHSHLNSLLELKDTTYFSLYPNATYPTLPDLDEELNLEDCKNNCLRNCSCKAAVFAYKLAGSGQRGCLLLSEIFSLIDNKEDSDKVSVFLKVERSNPLLKTSPKKIRKLGLSY